MAKWRLNCLVGIGLAFGAAMAAPSTLASPVCWPGSWHYYDRIDAYQINWFDAKNQAESLIYGGVQGHLVTITSQPEQDFIVNTFMPAPDFDERHWWLGGFQPEGLDPALEPAGGWEWVTGEPWVFTAWSAAQPDNWGGFGGENHLQIWIDAPVPAPNWGLWNDRTATDSGDTLGYIVEFETIPEPATMVLVATGIVAIAARAQRKK